MPQAQPLARSSEGEGFVAGAVVGHDALDLDAEARVVGNRSFEEGDGAACRSFFITLLKAMREASSMQTWTNSAAMSTVAHCRDRRRISGHPQRLLRKDILPALNMTKAAIAGALGTSRQHPYDILGDKELVSPEIAARLGKAFGDGAAVWLRMQAAYDA